MIFISSFTSFILVGCSGSTNSAGKYFVDSKYIIAKASLTSTVKNSNDEVEYYGIDISYDSDIRLNSVKYKCELYSNNRVVETFEGEVLTNGLYARYIPLKTTKEYEYARVICTGWSDENPEDFVRLNAMSSAEMQQCEHNDLILAQIESRSTNNKNDYMIINYKSDTAYGKFRFFYQNYNVSISKNVKVCVKCGYYENNNSI